MNMAYNNSYQEQEFEYGEEGAERGGKAKDYKAAKRPMYGKGKKSAPSAFNGMHRRRNKRFTW